MSEARLPPALASEVSAQVVGIEPTIRRLFMMAEVPIPGEDLERLLCAVWLHGYERGVEECLGNVPALILEAAETSEVG